MGSGPFTPKALLICAALMTIGRIAVAAIDSYEPMAALSPAPTATAPHRSADVAPLAAFATNPPMVHPLPSGTKLASAVPGPWGFDRSAQEWWETF